jgi:diguanylate cyclase (GGDEF)-like protein
MLAARQHEVRVFADGLEALNYIKSDVGVNAVIASADSPSICGLELCWETRLLATSHRPIYVILMSSGTDHDNVAVALDHGADDFLSMPPKPEELYARLRSAERLCTMQRELIRLATTDALTGMFNRRAFFEKARDLCRRAEVDTPLCAIMVDIDHFKRINDAHGHDVGDAAICEVAHALMSDGVLVGRLGGEEFALLLEGRLLAGAVSVAEALRRSIAGRAIGVEGAVLTMTCSFGVSEWQAGDNIDRLLKRADMALYEAKLAGRNRVVPADRNLVSPTYSDAGRPVRAARKSA